MFRHGCRGEFLPVESGRVKKIPVSPGIPTAREGTTQTLRHAALSELRHNLRTPVNHVLGYTEMLIEDASEAHNAAALEALRQIHSTARGALADILAALSNRDAVEPAEIQALYERIRPRVDRIEHYLEHLRADVDPPAEWWNDLERIGVEAQSIIGWLGGQPPPVSPEQPEPLPLPQPQSGEARLLVVDADLATRTVLHRRLERQGYLIEEATTSHEVADRLAAERFDLVLLDINMLGPDGFELLQRRRHDIRLRQVPVVVVCAPDQTDGVVRAIELGAEDYLCRPFDPALLRTRIEAVLERKRLADQSKIGSLGVLTAEVVHEVRNPLNFVLNFAELAEELSHEQKALLEAKPPGALEEALEMAKEMSQQLAKIREHGARIEEVLASMLANSGEPPKSSEKEPPAVPGVLR
jgi:DNA-binding response OmpR family regulator